MYNIRSINTQMHITHTLTHITTYTWIPEMQIFKEKITYTNEVITNMRLHD